MMEINKRAIGGKNEEMQNMESIQERS